MIVASRRSSQQESDRHPPPRENDFVRHDTCLLCRTWSLAEFRRSGEGTGFVVRRAPHPRNPSHASNIEAPFTPNRLPTRAQPTRQLANTQKPPQLALVFHLAHKSPHPPEARSVHWPRSGIGKARHESRRCSSIPQHYIKNGRAGFTRFEDISALQAERALQGTGRKWRQTTMASARLPEQPHHRDHPVHRLARAVQNWGD